MKLRLVGSGVALLALSLALGALAMPSERAAAPRPFTVSGSVGDLLPGEPVPFRVTVRNAHRFALRVISLRASVSGSAACGARYLRVSPIRRSLVVPARGRRRATLVATLAASAPDSCRLAPSGFGTAGRR